MENPPKKDLLTVGEISEICNISSRTLRHYDRIELLKPAYVDPNTGYRYYERHQIFHISLIQDLKSLGFSLPEIKEALKREEMATMKELYKNKENEISRKIEELKRIQDRIRSRLELFDKISFLESNIQDFPDIYIELKQIPDRYSIATRYKNAFDFESMAYRVKEIQNILAQKQMEAEGPYYIAFHENFEHPNNTDLEVGILISGSSRGSSSQVKTLPGGLYATTLHWGPHETSISTYRNLIQWIENHSYKITGPPIKIYMKSLAFTPSPEQLLSEIQVPIQKK
jgi:DNA-binding transcriptional MerR regulator/effector-binding domain-containing protein